VVNTTQQIGGSLGTALLSTVAFTAVSNYISERAATLTDPSGLPALISEGSVHGYGVAFRWAAGLFALAIVIALVVIRAKKSDLPAGAAVHMG
jgi:hypothetical protein